MPNTEKNSNLVLSYLQTIPYWKVATYASIGRRYFLHPRTVAAILSKNQNQDIFPCYKVIHSNGKIGGYNLGVDEKIKRLTAQGIIIKDSKIDKSYFFECSQKRKHETD